MANKQINEFPLFTTPASNSDILHAKQGPTNKRVTIEQLRSEVGSAGNFYLAAGTDNVITLTAAGNSANVTEYFDGLTIEFLPTLTNTAGVTLDINSLGARNLYLNGAVLPASALTVGHNVKAKFSVANNRFNLDISETLFPNIAGVITSTSVEFNKLTGLTSSTVELNKLTGLTTSTVELNKLDGLTSSTVELNKLDGVTVGVTEFNWLTGLNQFLATTSNVIFNNLTVNGAFTSKGIDDNAVTLALTIHASGAGSFGTTIAQQKFHLHDTGTNVYQHFSTGNTGTTSLDGSDIGINADNSFSIWNLENASINFGTNNTQVLRIHASGRLSQGTTSETFNQHIHNVTASSNCYTHYTNGSTGALSTDGFVVGVYSVGIASLHNLESQPITFSIAGSEFLRLYADGGLTGGTPAGLSKGPGTSNFQNGVFDNGTRLYKPTEVTNYVTGQNVTVYNPGGSTAEPFKSFTSLGTGYADITTTEWPILSVVPSTAKAIIVRAYVAATTSSIGQVASSITVLSYGSVSGGTNIENKIVEASFRNTSGVSETNTSVATSIIPIDSLARFTMYILISGTGSIALSLQGWIE